MVGRPFRFLRIIRIVRYIRSLRILAATIVGALPATVKVGASIVHPGVMSP